jgi:hypothetical protein
VKQTWGQRGLHIRFCFEVQKEGANWEDLDEAGMIILICILKGQVWDGMNWIDLTQDWDSGMLLRTRYHIFGFHKTFVNS